jgi:glycosyltransferase involved in cell wall biosynthesis
MSISLSQVNLSHTPKVSIIITNYKKEKYLKNAILSCLSQTYENIEILIINDSSDIKKSFKIARKFKNKKIKYFYTTRNYGHYACCNFAMDKATGAYITFLGADDTMDNDHIENLLKVKFLNNCIMVHSLYNRYDDKGNLLAENLMCEASILFNREQVLKDIGYFHMIRAGADTNFSLRMLAFYTREKCFTFSKVSYRAIQDDSCLTVDDDIMDMRKQYYQNTINFLHSTEKEDLYYDYKKSNFPFAVPDFIKVKNFDLKTFKEKKII